MAEAQRRARHDGAEAYASITLPWDPEHDPAAAILAARAPGERAFCFEQADRDGYAICGLGTAAAVEASGRDRFRLAARQARAIGARTVADDPARDPGAPAGAGPLFTGGFAFADAGARTPEWHGFPALRLVLPAISVARGRAGARLTVTVAVAPDSDAEGAVRDGYEQAARIVPAAMPLLDPDPAERPRVGASSPPSHYEDAVRRAIERIRAGEFEKIVLAREVSVRAPAEIDPAPLHGALRGAFASCYCYLVAEAHATFLGASPELLLRRDGARAQTVALAGTTRRSADPAVDDHLGEQLLRSDKNRAEQAIVTRRIERALDPVSVWTAAAPEPALVKVLNVQHLATPIRAQLSRAVPALELAGILHPTPAVGGEPGAVAEAAIPALEGLDRGWYAGGVGWTDLAEDGEFSVALRCALLRGETARLYAGCGIVADSEPAAELAETEDKLQALLPLLA